jgi:DNA ligase-1
MTTFDLCTHLGRDKKHLFQKLQPIEKIKDTTKLKFPMWASEKFDGVFCCALKKPDGTIGIFSRTGEEYLSMEHLKLRLGNLLKETGAKFALFEAWIPDTNQSEISGKCRDTKNQHEDLKAMCHSIVYCSSLIELSDRNAPTLGFIRRSLTDSMPYVKHVKVDSLDEAIELANSVWLRGGEGIVLNEINAPYQPGKRNVSMIKIKKILSYDLEVIGIDEGTGKYKGMVGAIRVRYKDGKVVTVSGMTDSQRKAWWKNPYEIIGKIVQIDAMTESSKGLLREPRFKGIRYDKEEADF